VTHIESLCVEDRYVKLRLGIVLWLLSWVPYGVILGLSGAARTVAWIVEIGLGIGGLALAGSEFAPAVKAKGWKRAPGVMWQALLHGQDVQAVD
jgi:hypothetical protein